MMKVFQFSKQLVLLIFLGALISSCSSEDINENEDFTSLSFKLTSTSTLYNAVYLDVKDVEIQIAEDASNPKSWMSLGALNSGVYNFTDIDDDEELILVEDMVIPVTHIYKVKLELGDDNAMVLNNVLHAIDTPTEDHKESVNIVDRTLKANKSYEFTLRFELDNSIKVEGMDVTLNPKMNTEMRLYELY